MSTAPRPDAPAPPGVSGPRLDRDVTLHLMGDWGQANLHRVCCWLSQEVVDRTGPGSRIAIWNGRGMMDACRAVADGAVHVALTVPAAFAPAAVRGDPPFTRPLPELRALAVIPQDDRLIVAIDATLPYRSFADLRAARPALRVATSMDDGVSTIGLAAHALLREAGIDVVGWGGTFVEHDRPEHCIAELAAGRADVLIQEAVMAPFWHDLVARRPLAFLPVEHGVLAALERRGWPRGVLRAGWFPGVPELPTLDFSDFLVIVREDLPRDLAHLLTWCLTETRGNLERWYRHRPPERSGITWPLDPARMRRVPIPLHPGAADHYG